MSRIPRLAHYLFRIRIIAEVITQNCASERERKREKLLIKEGNEKERTKETHKECPFKKLSLLNVTVQSFVMNRRRLIDNPVLYSFLQ